jgi:ABC-type transporter Mla maintaining outer membrane lipid asymmetry ATPase subunit MlaF
VTPKALEFIGVVKDYRGLRPLRVQHLAVQAGEIVALDGLDQVAAAVLTDLATGTTLPEDGEIRVEGRPTASVRTPDEWLVFLNRFGIVNDRVALLDGLTVAQNLAMPLTLELDPLAASERQRVEQVAAAVGLPASDLDRPLPGTSPLATFRVRLGRAVALGPRILLIEHPTLGLSAAETGAAAVGIRRVQSELGPAVLVATGDRRLARRVATRSLVLRPATGAVEVVHAWRWLR